MADFPFFQHHVIKLTFFKKVEIKEDLIKEIADLLIKSLELNVVKKDKYQFDNNGLTMFWILSQSHLVIHSWPENNALHVDLMTCSDFVYDNENITKIFSSFYLKKIVIKKLEY